MFNPATAIHLNKVTMFKRWSTGRERVSKKAPTTTMNDNPIAPLPTMPISFSFFIFGPANPLNKNPSKGKRTVRYIRSIIDYRLPLENIYFINIDGELIPVNSNDYC